MDINSKLRQAGVVAEGMEFLGMCIKAGINNLLESYGRINATSCNVKLVRSIMVPQGALLKQGVAVVDRGHGNRITTYESVSFQKMGPMVQEAIKNAVTTAGQFAKYSKISIDKIMHADQGQFSIDDSDQVTPYMRKVRVVTMVTYSLKD